MAESTLRQQWLMYGRLTLDLINSQRQKKDHISGVGMYPYWENANNKSVTDEDIKNFAEVLKGVEWLTVTTS